MLRITSYHNQYHNAHTRALQRRNITISLLLVFTLGLGAMVYGKINENPVSPPPAQAAPVVPPTDAITDPLYAEISADPIKKDIYLTFGQIDLKTAREALEIVKQESNFNPKAHNPTSSAKGLFEIIDGTWKRYHCTGNVFDPSDNTACAVKIYKSNGSWVQWATHPIYL